MKSRQRTEDIEPTHYSTDCFSFSHAPKPEIGPTSCRFRRNGASQHCRIKTKEDNGETRYCLGENDNFVNLYTLIEYYKSHALRTPSFEITLTEAIPPVSKENSRLKMFSQNMDEFKKVGLANCITIKISLTYFFLSSLAYYAS